MFIVVHSHCVTCIPVRMFFSFLLIISFFSASQSAETEFLRSETIAVENPSALNLTTMLMEGFAPLNVVPVVVDECYKENVFCPDGAFCVYRNGSYVCIKCPPGERIRPGYNRCSCDYEECSKFYERSCQPGSEDSYECLCKPEFVDDLNKENCKPRCPFGSSLNFTSYSKVDCLCPYSHEKHGSFCLKKCWNRRECNGGECRPLRHLSNFVCACPYGFKLDHDKRQCIDVDECRSRRRRCHANDVCANLPGGYVCLNFECDQGFIPQTELGLCLRKRNDITHFMRKAASGLIMRDIRENQVFSTTKLPKAWKFQHRELKIDPEEYAEYIEVSIQCKDDGSQDLIMKSIKPFPREGKVIIQVFTESPEDAFMFELLTTLYVSRFPFTVDIIGHD